MIRYTHTLAARTMCSSTFAIKQLNKVKECIQQLHNEGETVTANHYAHAMDAAIICDQQLDVINFMNDMKERNVLPNQICLLSALTVLEEQQKWQEAIDLLMYYKEMGIFPRNPVYKSIGEALDRKASLRTYIREIRMVHKLKQNSMLPTRKRTEEQKKQDKEFAAWIHQNTRNNPKQYFPDSFLQNLGLLTEEDINLRRQRNSSVIG